MQTKEKNSVTVSIVIPTFNRSELLSQTVEACLAQSYPDERLEIIVVDDGGTDNTQAVVQGLIGKTGKTLRYLRQEKNRGPSAARNHGIEAARGELILFLDDDVLPGTYVVEEHLKFLNEYPNCVSQGFVIPGEGTHLIDEIHWKESFKEEAVHGQDQGFGIAPGNFCIRKDQLLRVGLFDEGCVPMQGLELGFRLMRDLGIRVRLNKKAAVSHRSFLGFKAYTKRFWQGGRSLVRMIRKEPSILHPKFSTRISQGFKMKLSCISRFSPLSAEALRSSLDRISFLEQQLASGVTDCRETLCAEYLKVLVYCGDEGVYQEVHGIQSSWPSIYPLLVDHA